MTLTPALQPIFSVGTESIVGYEALARWNDAGLWRRPHESSPDWAATDLAMFEKLAEIGDSIKQKSACLFVNVSAYTLDQTNTFNNWLSIASDMADVMDSDCVIEITEQIPDQLLMNRWDQLRALGTSLAIDDFGDGQSQLARLQGYDWDFCKFDAKRTVDMRDAGALLYCQKEDIKMIIEKVETQSEKILGRLFGLDWQQGYYFAKPQLITELDCVKD